MKKAFRVLFVFAAFYWMHEALTLRSSVPLPPIQPRVVDFQIMMPEDGEVSRLSEWPMCVPQSVQKHVVYKLALSRDAFSGAVCTVLLAQR